MEDSLNQVSLLITALISDVKLGAERQLHTQTGGDRRARRDIEIRGIVHPVQLNMQPNERNSVFG